jgi:hypothetical protein
MHQARVGIFRGLMLPLLVSRCISVAALVDRVPTFFWASGVCSVQACPQTQGNSLPVHQWGRSGRSATAHCPSEANFTLAQKSTEGWSLISLQS